jgi:hypothetical protein
MTASLRQLNLREELCSSAEALFCKGPRPQFPSLEKLIEFLLGEVTREDAAGLDQKEQRIIEERLKALGYM